MQEIKKQGSSAQCSGNFEIWFNDLKDKAQKALLRFKGLQWPDEAGLYDMPLVVLSRKRVVEVGGRKVVSCPFCEGTNTVLRVGMTCCSALAPDNYRCEDCGRWFCPTMDP